MFELKVHAVDCAHETDMMILICPLRPFTTEVTNGVTAKQLLESEVMVYIDPGSDTEVVNWSQPALVHEGATDNSLTTALLFAGQTTV